MAPGPGTPAPPLKTTHSLCKNKTQFKRASQPARARASGKTKEWNSKWPNKNGWKYHIVYYNFGKSVL